MFIAKVVIIPSAWDYSAWVRAYALFLEERLECLRVLKYDVETERPVSNLNSFPRLRFRFPGCLAYDIHNFPSCSNLTLARTFGLCLEFQ